MIQKEEKKLKDKAREFFAALANVPGAFRLVWRADQNTTIAMGGLSLVGAILPALQAWVAKLIVDNVLDSLAKGLGGSAGLHSALPYLFAEFALLLIGTSVTQARRLAEELLDHRLGHSINTQIIAKALSLELHFFEDSEFYDKMQNARRQSEYRALAIINGGFMLLQNLITLVSFVVILLSFNIWIALILFGATLPSFVVQSRYGRLRFRLQNWRAPESRRMQYLEHLLTVDTSVKEIKLFNLGPPLIKKYDEIFWKIFNEDRKLAWRSTGVSLIWALFRSATFYGAYAWIISLTAAKIITLGGMTLYLTLFRQSQGTFQGLLDNVGQLFENGLFMDNLFSFLALKPMSESVAPASPKNGVAAGIEFRNVSFRYPSMTREIKGSAEAGRWALRGLNLKISAGEKIALVGENGAGKTTLIKLLTRLYDPTEGEIFLDGINLKDYPLTELRHKVGVIFQDYVKYQTTLKENIGYGSIENMEETAQIKKAAGQGGADDLISILPEGLETMLGHWFEGGQDLSGGQWQKIALSRAFMRDAEVLVLDEPTSALDAEREYEIFQRFRKLTEGKTAILISHRFSTVRMADRILVIKDGGVSEQGSHAQLLSQGGVYSRLFTLQAEGYR